MRNWLNGIVLFTFLLIGCSSENNPYAEWEVFGAEITPVSISTVSDVIDEFELDLEKEFTISGELKTVCQSKGCWTILEAEDGREVRMTFRDYSFFLPIESAGRFVIAEGVGLKKVTSVDELRHYAEDNNASEEEILAIVEPKVEYLFEANSVLMQ